MCAIIVPWEIEIKTMRYLFIPTGMGLTVPSVDEEVEGLELLQYRWAEFKVVQSLWETIWHFLISLNTSLLYDTAIPLLGIYPKGWTSLYENVHNSLIYNSQRLETTQVSTNMGIYKQKGYVHKMDYCSTVTTTKND